jgi:hypothetical protein
VYRGCALPNFNIVRLICRQQVTKKQQEEMNYKTLTPTEAKAFFDNINAQPLGSTLTYASLPVLEDMAPGVRAFAIGDSWHTFDSGEAERMIDAGQITVRVPVSEPFEIPMVPFKNVGERLPTAVQWDNRGYSYTIHQNGAVVINGIDPKGMYGSILATFDHPEVAKRAYEIAARICKLCCNEVHPYAVAYDIELFIANIIDSSPEAPKDAVKG